MSIHNAKVATVAGIKKANEEKKKGRVFCLFMYLKKKFIKNGGFWHGRCRKYIFLFSL